MSRPQVEAVGNMVGIFQDLRLRRVAFAPVPFLLQFIGERIGILHALDVAARAGIPVPVPGAADAAALLVDPRPTIRARAAGAACTCRQNRRRPRRHRRSRCRALSAGDRIARRTSVRAPSEFFAWSRASILPDGAKAQETKRPAGLHICHRTRADTARRLRRKIRAAKPAWLAAPDALASLRPSPFKERAGSAELPQGVDTIMKSPICDMLGVEFPLLAFSHCRDVVAAVSRAGGFGVLGATTHSPEIDRAGAEMDRRPCRRQALWPRRADPGEHFDRRREKRHLEKPRSADFARASRLHPQPAEEIRHRADRPPMSPTISRSRSTASARWRCSMSPSAIRSA